MGVGASRVFNDRIVAGAVWPMHPHRDIESLTYVIDVAGETALAGGDAAELHGPEELVVFARGLADLILVDVPVELRPVGVWAG